MTFQVYALVTMPPRKTSPDSSIGLTRAGGAVSSVITDCVIIDRDTCLEHIKRIETAAACRFFTRARIVTKCFTVPRIVKIHFVGAPAFNTPLKTEVGGTLVCAIV